MTIYILILINLETYLKCQTLKCYSGTQKENFNENGTQTHGKLNTEFRYTFYNRYYI